MSDFINGFASNLSSWLNALVTKGIDFLMFWKDWSKSTKILAIILILFFLFGWLMIKEVYFKGHPPSWMRE